MYTPTLEAPLTFANPAALTDADWEAAFARYDEQTYQDALDALAPDEIVLDIGAGDLHFTQRVAARVQFVYALEQRAELLPRKVPHNVHVIHGDARRVKFPKNISAALLLMRHCAHFGLYREKLERAGCRKLITNARWGMNVEVIDLRAPRIAFANFKGGWYACACGCGGFKETDVFSEAVVELLNCPSCMKK